MHLYYNSKQLNIHNHFSFNLHHLSYVGCYTLRCYRLFDIVRTTSGRGQATTSCRQVDTSKNSGRIGDRLIHFVRLKTECWHGWATGVF